MKYFYGFLGLLFLAIGGLGVVLPVLPTTPFLLLATFFFSRSSERFNQWFLSTKLYKCHLDSFVKSRSMPLKTKWSILLPVSVMLVTAFILMDNLAGRITIVALIILKYWYFFTKIKTIESVCKIESENKSLPSDLS